MDVLRPIKSVFLPLIILFSSGLIAQTAVVPAPFDVQGANKKIALISHQLTKKALDPKKIEAALVKIDNMRDKANACVDAAQIKREALKKKLSVALSLKDQERSVTTPNLLTAEQQSLVHEDEALKKRLRSCHLFVIRADEVTKALSDRLQHLVTRKLFKAESSIIRNLQLFPQLASEIIENFDLREFAKRAGIHVLPPMHFAIFMLVVLMSLLFSMRFRWMLGKHIRELVGGKETTRSLSNSFLCVLQHYSISLITFTSIAVFLMVVSAVTKTVVIFATMSVAIVLYILYLMLVSLCFSPPKPARPISRVNAAIGRRLSSRLKIFGSLCLFATAAIILLESQEIPPAAIHLALTFIISILAINLISIIWLLNRVPRFITEKVSLRFFLSTVFTVTITGIVFAAWIGYHFLASYTLLGIVLTLLCGFGVWFANNLINILLKSITSDEFGWQQYLRRHLGLRQHEYIFELTILRAVLLITIWMSFIFALFKIWGLPIADFRLLVDTLLNGFEVADVTIIPSHILVGAFVLISLTLFTRWIKSTLRQKPRRPGMQRGSRRAVASIMGYIGFSVSLVTAMFVAGVNFTGLAIIAGALSVGIGFGLRDVVNNFVSGIILLIERPIKHGDRIKVGEVEGYVKKISIRSTVIHSLIRTDVIVPNSDLISGQVTNLMFHDPNTRLSIYVGVGYNSDVDLVQKLLLDVAREHPSVIENDKIKAMALFNKFGDSSLEFELRVVIEDVRRRQTVRSELHFAVNKVFREHHIAIPYPQQDLYIKQWPKEPPPRGLE